MKITLLTGCLIVAAILAAQTSPASRKAQGLVQAAQAKESVRGDLKGAIELYRSAAREAGSDHATATRALLAAAACYEKQGATEAHKVYEEILAKYPGQKEAVAVARRKLGHSVSGAAPHTRQLWAGPEVDDEGGVSPDGRWLTYAHWATGDLGLRDLQNGSHRLLTNEGGWEKSKGQFAEDSLFSPDGKLIAYNWFIQKADHEIRIMNFDGTGVRTIFKGGWVVPQAWSPDGKYLGVHSYDEKGLSTIFVVPVSGGEPRQMLPRASQQPWEMSFSPDGRWLAFDMASHGSPPDIYLIALAGGDPVRLTDNPASDIGPVWSPDGKIIRFLSNRSGSFGMWQLPVTDGRPSGPPTLLKPDLGSRAYPIGFTKSGSYVYSLNSGGEDLYEVDYNPATNKVTSSPRLVPVTIPGRNGYPSYSPDGRYLAWLQSGNPMPSTALVLRDIHSGAEQHFPLKKPAQRLRWSPDSKRVLLEHFLAEPNAGTITVFDVGSKIVSDLLKVHPTRANVSPCWSMDGKTVFYMHRHWGQGGNGNFSIVAMNLASEEKRTLFQSSDSARSVALSLTPDGKHLGLLQQGRSRSGTGQGRTSTMLLIPVEGGEPRVAATWQSNGGDFHGSFDFTPDGKSAVVRAVLTEGEAAPSDLLHIDLNSGKVTPLGLSMRSIQNPSVHPSGRKIVFKAGQDAKEIWVAENILPPAK